MDTSSIWDSKVVLKQHHVSGRSLVEEELVLYLLNLACSEQCHD